MTRSSDLTFRTIFLFWFPLAATWLMMSVEGPLMTAIIARLPESKFNLAAYGVAFSFALIIEAPVIMFMSASTALARNWSAFLKMRTFMFTLCALTTLSMIVLVMPPVFRVVGESWISLPHQVAELTRVSLIILLPWPGAIGYRRFYQGILIRNGHTRRVAYGTVVRLLAMMTTALALFSFSGLQGTYVGACALSTGVVLEALSSRFMVHSVLRKVRSDSEGRAIDSALSYSEIILFYYPLALTSMLSLGVHPLITFFVVNSRNSIESLAVLPVINALVFVFRSLGLAYQDVGIALIGDRLEHYAPLRNFAQMLTVLAVAGLATIAFTPLYGVWFQQLSGLTVELSRIARLPLAILVVMPGLSILLSFQRAMAVNLRATRYVTWASTIEVIGIALVLFAGIRVFDLVGAVAAALAMVAGRAGANFYLAFPLHRQLVRFNQAE